MAENPLDKLNREQIVALGDELNQLYTDAEEAADQMQGLDLRMAAGYPERMRQQYRDAAWTALEILRHNAALTERKIAKILAAADGKPPQPPPPDVDESIITTIEAG